MGQAASLILPERDRLAELRRLKLLDSLPEASFDKLVESVARLFAAPMAAISLIDADRQWFKAKIGVGAAGTGRASLFCKQTICSDEPLLVADALEDSRFSGDPTVTGAPFVRFYAGAPLRTSGGGIIGTICVGDTSPRIAHMVDRLAFLEAMARRTIEAIEHQADRERDDYTWPA